MYGRHVGPGGGYLRGLDRMWRLWKSWRPFTSAAKDQAQRDRIARVHEELEALKKDGPPHDQAE
jgi:hypothetical protein